MPAPPPRRSRPSTSSATSRLISTRPSKSCLPPGGRSRELRDCARRSALLCAARSKRQRSADLAHPLDRQSRDPRSKELLRNERQIVERERALLRHPVACVENHLGRNLTDRSRRRNGEERVHNRDCRLARQDEKRTAPRVRMLDPPDLASGYQGSSRIAAIALLSAHGSSADGGTRAYPRTIAASIAAASPVPSSRSIASLTTSDRERPEAAA